MMAERLVTGKRARPFSGFAYIFLLIAVAVIGGAGALSVQLGSTMARRDAEGRLREVGRAFSQALDSYAAMTPQGMMPAPKTLEQLLRDDRFPAVVRHLRRIYDDPITGGATWGLLRDGQGFIVGVYSLSDSVPVGAAPSQVGEVIGAQGRCQAYRCWIFIRMISPLPQSPAKLPG